MKRRDILSFTLGTAALAALPAAAIAVTTLPRVEVFKSPTCSCCGAWVDHMKAAGFDIKVTELEDTSVARKRLGMPEKFGSCHTAVVGAYVLEGHVPAADVKRLLNDKPDALGLAVPGMVAGSPGMEVGTRRDPYKVLLIDKRGHETVFASYPKA